MNRRTLLYAAALVLLWFPWATAWKFAQNVEWPTPGPSVAFTEPHVLAWQEITEPNDAINRLFGRSPFTDWLQSIGSFRKWDDDTQLANAPAEFQKLAEIAQPHSPCVVLAKDRGVQIIKSPADAESLEKTIRNWGAGL